MAKKDLEKYLRVLSSKDDHEAVMGLLGAQNLFQSLGGSVEDALRYALENIDVWKRREEKMIDQPPEKKMASAAVTNVSGVPECRVSKAGVLEVVQPGKVQGDAYALPGESARYADAIAGNLKDAIVAAVINKSRFKLKLLDVRNGKGEVTETVLRAEYERAGMTPVCVWGNSRGEVGALAAVLRKAMANSLPELVAA